MFLVHAKNRICDCCAIVTVYNKLVLSAKDLLYQEQRGMKDLKALICKLYKPIWSAQSHYCTVVLT
jgi:hypothetical protein